MQGFSLAIDAMGGDNAPDIVLDGLELAAERHPEARFLLIGDEARLSGMLALRKRAARLCSLRDARNLVEFAIMGETFARAVLGLPAPTFGLLNVGSEELKGDERLRLAAETLRESHVGAQF